MLRKALLGATMLASLYAFEVHAQTPVVGFESGPAALTVTPGGTHSANGQVLGPNNTTTGGTPASLVGTNQSGLFVIPIARDNGKPGIITQFSFTSSGGSTVQMVGRIWSRLPSNTTCKDGTPFAGNFTTDDAYLITPPFSFTPAAPASTVGDSSTYASITGLTYTFQNVDLNGPTRNLYVCVEITASDSSDNNNAARVMLSGPLD